MRFVQLRRHSSWLPPTWSLKYGLNVIPSQLEQIDVPIRKKYLRGVADRNNIIFQQTKINVFAIRKWRDRFYYFVELWICVHLLTSTLVSILLNLFNVQWSVPHGKEDKTAMTSFSINRNGKFFRSEEYTLFRYLARRFTRQGEDLISQIKTSIYDWVNKWYKTTLQLLYNHQMHKRTFHCANQPIEESVLHFHPKCVVFNQYGNTGKNEL